MRNLSVKVNADIGGYTTNMSLASRVAREKMGESAASVDDFQKSIMRASDELATAARSMGGNMQAANGVIKKNATEATIAIEKIGASANDAKFETLGEKVGAAMAAGTAEAKTHWEEFSTWLEAKAKITGIAVGVLMTAVGLGAIYAVYKVISTTIGFVAGLLTGESYKSESIDAVIAANKQIKDLQENLRLTAQEAAGVNAAIASIGGSKTDYISVFSGTEKAVRSNIEEFERLGIAYKDAGGKLLPLETVIQNVNKKLNEYTEGWDRNQAAAAIGIGSAAQVAAAVSISSAKIQEARARLDDYNLGIGDDTQAAVTRYEAAMRDFNRESELTAQGFKRAWSDQIMPALTDFAEFFKEGFPFAVNVFRYSMATVTSLFYGLKTSVYIVAESILGGIESMGAAITGLASASILALRGDFSGAKDALVRGWTEAKERIGKVGENIVAQARHNADAMRQAWALDDRRDGLRAGPRGKPWVPKPDVPKAVTAEKDDVAKAILEGRIKELEGFITAEQAQLQGRQQFLQSYYQQEYLTAEEFYSTKQRLIRETLQDQLDAYDLEISARIDFRKTRDKDKDRQEADNRIAEVQAKKAAAIAKANQDITLSYVERMSIQRQFDLASKDWNRTETLNNEALQFGIDMMGRSTLEMEKATAARRIQLAVEERIYQLRKRDPNADVSGALADAEAQSARAQQLITERAEKQKDAWFGATEALRKYGEAAADVGSQIESTLTSAFRSAEDALVDFVRTGKIDFKKLADSIISDLIRIQIRASILGPLAKAANDNGGLIGGILKIFGLGGGKDPGTVQTPYDAVDTGPSYGDLVGGAAGFASGTDYVPKTGYALVHEGEEIVRPGSRGNVIYLNPTIHIDSRTDAAYVRQEVNRGMQQAIAAVPGQVRRGGSYKRAVRG